MKKYILFILTAMLMASCSNGLEEQAKQHLEKAIKELLKNPDSAKFTNMKTELNNDSLCIIHVTCIAKNGIGEYASSRFEYIYLKLNEEDIYKEGVFDLLETESVIKATWDIEKSVSKIANKKIRNGKDADEIERDSINHIYSVALVNLMFDGRDVE